MNIIAVDDERFALRDIERAITKALPDSPPVCFGAPSKAVAYAKEHQIDVAFLDIQMGGMNGLELAKQLKDLYGRTNIVFVTGYSQYAIDSYAIPASGYIMKPVSEQDILDVMARLRNPVIKDAKKLYVQCFGNFEVFADGVPLHFPRSKAKELFAYLVHKKGTGCTVREIAAVLFEGKEDNLSLKKQIQTHISTMMRVLEEAGAKDVINKGFNNIALNANKIDCDYYRFMQWDINAVNLYTGEYMASYGWAEFTIGYLDSKIL